MKIILENVTLIYPFLLTPKIWSNGKSQYIANFVLDKKEHSDKIKEIISIIKDLCPKFGISDAELRAQLTNCVTEEQKNQRNRHVNILLKAEDFFSNNLHYKNVFYIKATSKAKPQVVNKDPKVEVTLEDNLIVNGCIVNAVLNVFGFNNHTKGISAEIKAIQFVRQGEALANKELDFTDVFKDLSKENETIRNHTDDEIPF